MVFPVAPELESTAFMLSQDSVSVSVIVQFAVDFAPGYLVTAGDVNVTEET